MKSDLLNEEEDLLEFDLTSFTVLVSMMEKVEPYDKLWHTALDFYKMSDKWKNSSFEELNAVDIKDTVDNMWKLVYKLTKMFQDSHGSKKAAEFFFQQISDFKKFVPLLLAFCNQGLKERHWNAVIFYKILSRSFWSFFFAYLYNLFDPFFT